MSTLLKKEFHILEDITKGNPLAEAIALRAIHSLIASLKICNDSSLIDLNMLPDAAFALGIGQKMAESSVFVENGVSKRQDAINLFLKMFEKHGGGYSSKKLTQELSLTKSGISKQRKENKLFHIKVAGKIYHPVFQFNDDFSVSSNLKKVIKLLSNKDEMASFQFLTRLHDSFDGQKLPIYKLLKSKEQPLYIYEQIEEKAQRLDSIYGER